MSSEGKFEKKIAPGSTAEKAATLTTIPRLNNNGGECRFIYVVVGHRKEKNLIQEFTEGSKKTY